MLFLKGQFESGAAAKLLNDFAGDPFPYLDEKTKKKMLGAQSDLLRKFTELAFDGSAEMRWQKAQAPEADNIDVGLGAGLDLQTDLFGTSKNPF